MVNAKIFPVKHVPASAIISKPLRIFAHQGNSRSQVSPLLIALDALTIGVGNAD